MNNISAARRPRHGPAAHSAARFAAGAAAVLTVHQAAVWALHRAGFTPWPAYSLAPTRPFGVPAVASAAFWGGAWWAALSPAVERAPTRAGSRAGYWGRAAVLGAVPPTLVGAALAAAGRAFPRGGTPAAVLLGAGVLVNALWGVTAAALVRATGGIRAPPRARLEGARRPGTGARSGRRSRA